MSFSCDPFSFRIATVSKIVEDVHCDSMVSANLREYTKENMMLYEHTTIILTTYWLINWLDRSVVPCFFT